MTTRRSAPASLALARLLSICPPPLRARLGAYAPTPAARLLSQSESCRSPATARRPTDGIAIVYSSLRDFALAGLVIQDKMQRPRTIALSPADIAPAFVERSTKRSPLNQPGSRPVYRGLDVNRAPPGALRLLLKHSLSQAVSLSYRAKAPPDSVSSDRRPSRSLRQPFRRATYPWNQDAQSRSLDLLLPYRRSARTWPLPAQPADTGRACHYGSIRCIYHEDRAMQSACVTNTHYRTYDFAHLCKLTLAGASRRPSSGPSRPHNTASIQGLGVRLHAVAYSPERLRASRSMNTGPAAMTAPAERFGNLLPW